jgi:hypothetical protein
VRHRANRGNDGVKIGGDAGQSNVSINGDVAARERTVKAAHDLAPPDGPLAPQECTDSEHD